MATWKRSERKTKVNSGSSRVKKAVHSDSVPSIFIRTLLAYYFSSLINIQFTYWHICWTTRCVIATFLLILLIYIFTKLKLTVLAVVVNIQDFRVLLIKNLKNISLLYCPLMLQITCLLGTTIMVLQYIALGIINIFAVIPWSSRRQFQSKLLTLYKLPG